MIILLLNYNVGCQITLKWIISTGTANPGDERHERGLLCRCRRPTWRGQSEERDESSDGLSHFATSSTDQGN
jgi:hypothetical protein